MDIGTDAPRTFRGFRMVPDRLWLDPRLKANDVRVWCALCFTARGRDHTDATDQGLAAMMGMSERTIRDSLMRLEACGFVERTRRGERRAITLRPEGDGRALPELELRVIG
jgi:predicted transcriptional regulator of viral defense system